MRVDGEVDTPITTPTQALSWASVAYFAITAVAACAAVVVMVRFFHPH